LLSQSQSISIDDLDIKLSVGEHSLMLFNSIFCFSSKLKYVLEIQ